MGALCNLLKASCVKKKNLPVSPIKAQKYKMLFDCDPSKFHLCFCFLVVVFFFVLSLFCVTTSIKREISLRLRGRINNAELISVCDRVEQKAANDSKPANDESFVFPIVFFFFFIFLEKWNERRRTGFVLATGHLTFRSFWRFKSNF